MIQIFHIFNPVYNEKRTDGISRIRRGLFEFQYYLYETGTYPHCLM